MQFKASLEVHEPKLRLLASGIQKTEITQVADEGGISPETQKAIEVAWQEIMKKNPKAFAGSTVRLRDYEVSEGNILRINVLPSDYKKAMVLGWLGVAMVPLTSDGYVVLQAPVASVAATVGDGIRVPGCTPPRADFFSDIIAEMKEEFGVKVDLSDLSVLGLVEVLPPLAKHHYGLIVQVILKETFRELKKKWSAAEDRWEGEILPFKLTRQNVLTATFLEKEKYGPVTPVALCLVADKEFGNFGITLL